MKDNEPAGHHRLYEAVLTLKTPEECRLFFQDICTIKELQAIAQRLEVAALLDAGQNYNAVCERTGASTATISRVNKCLLYGNGGYRRVLDRMKEDTNE
jgi:TrpR-related protein YerC/YecD